MIAATCAAAASTSSFTTTWSNQARCSSSQPALASRSARRVSSSVPRDPEPPFELLERGRLEEDQHRVRRALADLPGALHVDLEQHVRARVEGVRPPRPSAFPSGGRRSPPTRAAPPSRPAGRTPRRRRSGSRPRPVRRCRGGRVVTETDRRRSGTSSSTRRTTRALARPPRGRRGRRGCRVGRPARVTSSRTRRAATPAASPRVP